MKARSGMVWMVSDALDARTALDLDGLGWSGGLPDWALSSKAVLAYRASETIQTNKHPY